MKAQTRIILIIGLGFLGLALAVYVKMQDSKSSLAVPDDRKHLKIAVDARNNRDKSEKDLPRPSKRQLIDIGVDYFIRQPVSKEIAKRAATLGVEIAPFFGSTKIALIVIRSGKSDSEFVALLKECSASDAEIAEARDKWWEENKERIKKEQETRENQPDVVAAKLQVEKRLEEIGKMRGLTDEEYSHLQLDALKELNKIRRKYIGVTTPQKK